MDDIELKAKLVNDINSWITRDSKNKVSLHYGSDRDLKRVIVHPSKILKHIDILKGCTVINFSNGQNILFAVIMFNPVFMLRFWPTTYTNITLKIKNSINVKYGGYQHTGFDDMDVYGVADLYSILNTHLEYDSNCMQWTIDNYFENIPKLSCIQYMIDKVSGNNNPDIIIEI